MSASRRERKVVTVVFCDLVGFTSKAESMDPEDVEALLAPYHQRVRAELERHGGTVEKFIGDAVMALFGAPTAHEDDPERAVRAALAIREFALEEELELRVGVTTGEALVRLDAQPDAGEGMASGDVVNTAARLQSGAPINGILVDDTTYRATRHVVDFDEPQTIEAKGKATPIAVRRVLEARARFGVDVAHEARSDLVGRERELGIVRDAFERARHERTPQLLTLVGVPGIGKSRLVYELNRIIDADPELVTWRQGRCLAYGDGITLWALGEIVKAQAGVLEQDAPSEIAAKMRRSVEDALAGTGDEDRVEAHLLALVGLAEETQLGGDRRNEAFSAWRRFLEALAEQRPLVLVVEDIHWADDALLDFLDELVDWLTDVPLLVVATARPELLERRPGWGGGKLNVTTLALSPLSDEQTAQLLGQLLGTPALDTDARHALLERAGGNPLYAEQFVALYAERGSTDGLGLPETLQGIIAARLDGLPGPEKAMLQDAAVVGKVFWASSIGRDANVAAASLHSLERKGFVRRQRRSSLEGESEFAFAHALVRDVSYGQIPRAERARRHRAVAEWLDGLGRAEDHAEMLAYHWSSALNLVRAAGREDEEIVERARLALRAAGDRAQSLNAYPVAVAQYEDALALWPDDDPDRPYLLFSLARALFYAYEPRREQALETARDALLAANDAVLAGEAEALLGNVAWDRGDGDAIRAHLARARDLVGDSLSPSAARVLATSARMFAIAEDPEPALELGQSALEMAERLELRETYAHALATIGMARNAVTPRSGVPAMEDALVIARELDSPVASAILNNLGVESVFNADLGRADELYAEALTLAERLGDRAQTRFMTAHRTFIDLACGRWDRAVSTADAFIAECESGLQHTAEANVRTSRALIREARGDVKGALEDVRQAIVAANRMDNPVPHLLAALTVRMVTLAEHGDPGEARAVSDELLPLVREFGPHGALTRLAVVAPDLDVADALGEAVRAHPVRRPRWLELIELALAKEFRAAASLAVSASFPALEARLRLAAATLLLEEGAEAPALEELERARAFYSAVGATFYLGRVDAALAEAQSASA